ncbi:AMP-binding protein [Porticoccus sp. W117]|uniref:AMP-binding protein n=1 Tax=Porticoccus sp. W117 TaxID=3054777 RepID=UPI00259492E6|nr:AMP-binding protein [Porticoccus sp. W117]MDM3870167.1 AMP-binding protein [Porticoccus sp. W117]
MSVQQAIDAARERFEIPANLPERIPATIVEVLRQGVKTAPKAPAFSALGGTLSYRKLDKLSDNFASYLQHHTALKPGDRLAIQLPNLLQYPVVVFGALKAGMVLVNTNPLYTPRELEKQLMDSGARALVVLDSLLHNSLEALPKTDVGLIISTSAVDMLPPAKGVLMGAAIKLLGKGRKVARQDNEVALLKALAQGGKQARTKVDIQPETLALLQYTGGTTGVAKGAELTHRNMMANTIQILGILKGGGLKVGKEIIIAPLPLYHIFAFMGSMVLMLYLRGHVHLIPDPRNLPSMIKVLRNSRFSIFFGLNTLFAGLMRHKDFPKVDCSALKLTISGGMALTDVVAEQWQQMTGCTITEGYGLTETSPVVSVNIPGHEVLGTIGVAVPGTEVRIVSEGMDQPLNEGGELWVRGPQVMRGYWNSPEETAECLDGEGWLRTGDIASVDDNGLLRILDRMKDMIIVSGFNVYPNEIENVLNSHPDVQESAAIGIPDDDSGEAIKVFAVITDPELTADKLKDWCREQLTGYKVPQQFEFCEDLPKSNVGKVLRAKLRT